MPKDIQFPRIEYNSNFSDNLNSAEIEYLFKEADLNELPFCILGDKGINIREEYEGEFSNKQFKKLIKNIQNGESCAIFLIYEGRHWFTCVVKSSTETINYYLANSGTNASIIDNYTSFQYLRGIIEKTNLDKIYQSYKKPKTQELDLDKKVNFTKNMYSIDSVDKDKELILSNLTSPYAEDSKDTLPPLELLINSKTEPLINQVKSILKDRPKFNDKIKSGLILYGPPGTGKTVLAELICREANRKIFFIGGGDLRTSYQASTQSILRRIIQKVGEYPEPCAIIIDEFDAIASKPKANDNSEDTMSLSFFKTCTQSLKNCKNKPYLLCTTNHIGKIDEAVERRFLSLLIDLPEEEKLIRIINFYLNQNKEKEFIQQNINEKFIKLLANYGFNDKFSCENVKAFIDSTIMEEEFNNPITHKLPWSYTKAIWSGSEFEQRLYNAYCNFTEHRNNLKKEREKEKNSKAILPKTPVLETVKHSAIQGSIMSGFAIAGYFAKRNYEKWKKDEKSDIQTLKDIARTLERVANALPKG